MKRSSKKHVWVKLGFGNKVQRQTAGFTIPARTVNWKCGSHEGHKTLTSPGFNGFGARLLFNSIELHHSPISERIRSLQGLWNISSRPEKYWQVWAQWYMLYRCQYCVRTTPCLYKIKWAYFVVGPWQRIALILFSWVFLFVFYFQNLYF